MRIPPRLLLSFVVPLVLGAVVPVMAQTASRAPGGIGPIRLGMFESEARAALSRVAHDVLLVRKTDVFGPTDPNEYKFAVAEPWVDAYVGALDAETKVQAGIGDGRVVSAYVRRTINGDDARCRREYAAGRSRLAREFGPFQKAEDNANPDSEGVRSVFRGWRLYFSRYAPASSGWCSLATDVIGDEDAGVEARWRRDQR